MPKTRMKIFFIIINKAANYGKDMLVGFMFAMSIGIA